MIAYVASGWFDGLHQQAPERIVGQRLHSNDLLTIGLVGDLQAGPWGGMSCAVFVRQVYIEPEVRLDRWPRC